MATNISPQTVAPTPGVPQTVLLHATTAVQVANGMVGGLNGIAGDTSLVRAVILKNAGPATLTIAGFAGEDGTARNVVLTGSATVDTVYQFDGSQVGGLVNTAAKMTLIASVADTALVSLKQA